MKGGETRGGQLRHFVHNWELLGAPSRVCSIIRGYAIPFPVKPPLRNLQTCLQNLVTPSSQEMDEVVESLLASDYLASVDLSQAYCHIPIVDRHRRFLTFLYKNRRYNWTCLPFGLATAPQSFALVTNWVAELFRKEGIRILVYLDDFLLAHQNRTCLQSQVDHVLRRLKFLGWTVNVMKSQLSPVRCIQFLGISWNTETNRISLPEKKVEAIRDLLRKFIRLKTWSLRGAQSLMGSLGFASFAIPLGRLHLRPIQLASRQLCQRSPRHLVRIPPNVVETLHWWMANIQKDVALHFPENRAFLSSDASDSGWGAQVAGQSYQGLWSVAQMKWHINVKELYAVRSAIWLNRRRLQNHTVILQSDNKTVVSYIRKQGELRSRALLLETTKLFSITFRWNIHILPFYIPGRLNTIADSLSRQTSVPEWHLKSSLTSSIFKRWGVPEIDLFASRTSRVVPRYASLNPNDIQAEFLDAFSRIWNFRLAWLFPPPPLIPQVLHHLNSARGSFLLVVPRWDKVFWKADLKARALAPPLTFSELRPHIVDLTTGLPPAQVDELTLEIWILQGGLPRYRTGL